MHRGLVHGLHFVAADVDHHLVFRMHRPDRQITVLGELAADHQPLAVGLFGLAHGGVEVAGLVVHVDAVEHHLGVLVTLEGLDRGGDVPLDHLAVEEQRGVGVAASVEGGVQRSETDLRLGNHGVARVLVLAVEPIEHLGEIDHGRGRRELAGADKVLAVRAGVDAVRIFRHRHVAGQCGLRILVGRLGAVHHRHVRARDFRDLAGLDRLLDTFDVEEHAGIALGRHHVGVHHAVFGVVLVGGREFAVERAGHEVHVAVDLALPADFHGFGIHTAEQRLVLGVVAHVAAVVRQRNVKLGAAEYARGVVDLGIDRVALVREDAVETLHVRQLGDLVALHELAANACDAPVNLVVGPEILAVVGAVLIGTVHVVGVAGVVLETAVGPRAEDFLRLVGDAPAGHGIGGVEHLDALDFAPRRHAHDAHFAGVAAAP